VAGHCRPSIQSFSSPCGLPLDDGFERFSDHPLFRDRIGEIIGQGEAMQEYGWRASLSGVGAFFLCMFMMAVGAFGGYVAFSPDDR
jgi:hypothetical protein